MLDLASPLDGFGSPFGARRGSFSIPGLFTSGALGLWYDPGTISTLFQDAAGTTAVAAAGDATGLDLDRSKGLVLGSELVTNGDFSSGTGWTPGTGWTISGGVASANILTGVNLDQSIVTTINKSYQVTYSITAFTSGSIRARLTGSANISGTIRSAVGTYTEILHATSGNSIFRILDGGSGFVGSIDNVSLREITGNHAFLSGANTLRPLYQVTPARLVFDATDDRLLTMYSPTISGTIAARIKGGTASKVALGSQGASNGKAFLALAADGSLGAGIGADSTSTIKGSADIRAAWATGVVTWDGSTVKLYQDGAQVYSGAQNGAVNTTVPWMFGCLNNNATAASFWDGSIGAALVLDRAMTASEVSSLTSTWSTIQ